MKNKPTNDTGKLIFDLKEEILQLQNKIDKKKIEIDRILFEADGDFEGCYVEFYDGAEYIFMKVERQIIRDNGSKINLQGPAIKLDDSPLNEDYDYDGELGMGSYDYNEGFTFPVIVLDGNKFQRIRKIEKDDMVFVLDHYVDVLKKNLI